MIEFENDPHTEAERRVLACVLHEPTQIRHVAHWLKPVHFAHDAHGQIYRNMLVLHERGEPITVERVYALFHERRRVQQGIFSLLFNLDALELTFPHIAFHAVPLKLRAGLAHVETLPEANVRIATLMPGERMATLVREHITRVLKSHGVQ